LSAASITCRCAKNAATQRQYSGINVLILAAYALGGLVLATIVVRRSTLAH